MLPVWIGGQEATSILIAVEGQQAPRPLSHDLITTLFAAVGAKVERVDVTRIEEGTFYAELTLSTPSGPQVLDSRPSDAIALALRADAPIWVADEVIDEAGIPAEMVDFGDDEAERGRRVQAVPRRRRPRGLPGLTRAGGRVASGGLAWRRVRSRDRRTDRSRRRRGAPSRELSGGARDGSGPARQAHLEPVPVARRDGCHAASTPRG